MQKNTYAMNFSHHTVWPFCRTATFVSPSALREALAGEESLCFADVLFHTFLVISVRPIISTSTGPIFTKFAKVSRTLVVDEQSGYFFHPFNVRSEADISQLNLPLETNNYKKLS